MSVVAEHGVAGHDSRVSRPLAGPGLEMSRSTRDFDHTVKILIVEENDVSRCGLRLIMASQAWVSVCASAARLGRAIDLIEQAAPDIVLFGARSGLDGAQQTGRALGAAAPGSVLVLVSSADRVSAQTLSLVGAVTHISRNCAAADIVNSVRLASLGQRVTPVAPPTVLSTRQQEVLELLAAGHTNCEIGERLYLSAHTVKQHTCAIYRKLQVRNRAEAINCSQRLGLLN